MIAHDSSAATSDARCHPSSHKRRSLKNLGCLLLAVVGLSGCGIQRELPTSQTVLIPADVHQVDELRTIETSYRIAGIDDFTHRTLRMEYLETITQELENCGYIVQEKPWASQIGKHVKLQVELGYDADLTMTVLSVLTLGALPEIRDDLTTVTVRAFAGRTMKLYEERILVKTARWCPLLVFLSPSHFTVIREEQAGMREVMRLIVRRLRDDQLLAQPRQTIP